MSIRLAEYISTINNNKPLTSIVFQLVLLGLIILTIISKQVTVHGQSLNESLTTVNNNDETLINSNKNIEVTTSKPQTIVGSSISSTIVDSLDPVDLQQQLTTPPLESGYYNVSVSPLGQQLDDINTQQSTLIDVKPVIRSEQQQQQSTPFNDLINNNTNNQSSLSGQQLVSRSPTMLSNTSNSSLPAHQNNSAIATNQSMIMICDPDRYTFDHQQVAKFFLTTMILLAFCCLLIVTLLVLVTYIYRKLSKGRNVKVWFNK